MDIGFASLEASSIDNSQPPGLSASKIPNAQPSSIASNSLALSSGAARDRRQTLTRYHAALHELETAIAEASGVWKNFNTVKFSCKVALEADSIMQLQSTINDTMDAQALARHNAQGWQKVKQVMKSVFIATSPFAKVLLIVSKQHSLVPVPSCLF